MFCSKASGALLLDISIITLHTLHIHALNHNILCSVWMDGFKNPLINKKKSYLFLLHKTAEVKMVKKNYKINVNINDVYRH